MAKVLLVLVVLAVAAELSHQAPLDATGLDEKAVPDYPWTFPPLKPIDPSIGTIEPLPNIPPFSSTGLLSKRSDDTTTDTDPKSSPIVPPLPGYVTQGPGGSFIRIPVRGGLLSK
ncbi:hypothetical protein RRG08_053117, partial [Elysia crispata]